ncbi:MAG: hypothetical protein ABIR71_06370 [Chthoniobacterales bacterium]
MNTPDPTPSSNEAKLPPNFRLKPSRNQKKRSKLQQVPDDSAPPAPAPPPVAPTPPPEPPTAPLLRQNRLKRSGHMHEDLTKPLPEDGPAERESEY